MSMTGNLARVSQRQYDDLHRNPSAVTALLSPEPAPAPAPPPSPAVISRLWTWIRSSPTQAPDGRLAEVDRVGLDRSWHALHYLLTGAAWEGEFPAGFLVSTGRPVGIVDVGYGPARSFSAQEVAELASYLRSLDEDHLRSRFDPRKLEEQDIYPNGWSRSPDVDQEWLYLRGTYRRMKTFILEAAARKMALLVYIT